MTICDPPRVWREDFKIHSYEIGPSGFASPQAICRFIQEAASNHAANLNVSAEDVARREQMWVLANLSLRMQTYPRWHQTMRIETWPVVNDSSIRGYRDLTLLGEDDGIIGRASTMWLLLDKENRKPLKIPRWLLDVASPGHDEQILRPVREKDISGAPQSTLEFDIRASDIDWNMHVNNVCYLEWALEAVPAPFRLKNKVVELDVSFVGEGKYGTSVIVQTFEPQSDERQYLHKILDKISNRPLAILRVLWQPKESQQFLFGVYAPEKAS